MRAIAILLAASFLATLPAAAQSIDKWDEDGDGMLSLGEFRDVIESAGWIAEWGGADGTIAYDEFRATLFDQFDDDASGTLSREEWAEGFRDWPGGLDWEGWDEDGDGVLDPGEFAEGAGVRGLYAGFAGRDFDLARSEFVEGIFDWYEGPDEDRLLGPEEAEPLMRLIGGDD